MILLLFPSAGIAAQCSVYRMLRTKPAPAQHVRQHSNPWASSPAPTLYFKQDSSRESLCLLGSKKPWSMESTPQVFPGLSMMLCTSFLRRGFRSKCRIRYLKLLPTDKGPSTLAPSIFPDSVSTARHSLPHTSLLMPKLHSQIHVTTGERINVLVGFGKTNFLKKNVSTWFLPELPSQADVLAKY